MDDDGRTPGGEDAGASKKKTTARSPRKGGSGSVPRAAAGRGRAAKTGDAPAGGPGTSPPAAHDVAPSSLETFINEPATTAPAGMAAAPPAVADAPSAPRVGHASSERPVPPALSAASAAPTKTTSGGDTGGGSDAGTTGGGGREPLKVGLLVGREWSFPPKFIEEVNGRDEGVTAEFVKLGAEHMDEPSAYAVIIDRISHEVPFYRTYLKHAVLQGTTVVNNSFMWSADDKFFGASLITTLGVASPKTAVLPNKSYIPGIVPSESLRNLEFPLDWKALVEWVGLPCILKDAHGGGWKEVYVCRSLDELLHHYDHSGLLTMVVQEFIEWDQFVRCLCVGQEHVLPMKYDPRERRYLVEHEHLAPELGTRIVRDARTIVRALGYDMNSIEFAVRDGVPYAIDFMNPAPDMDIYSLTPHYFEWAVKQMADMAIRLAKNPRRQAAELRWGNLLTAGRAG